MTAFMLLFSLMKGHFQYPNRTKDPGQCESTPKRRSVKYYKEFPFILLSLAALMAVPYR